MERSGVGIRSPKTSTPALIAQCDVLEGSVYLVYVGVENMSENVKGGSGDRGRAELLRPHVTRSWLESSPTFYFWSPDQSNKQEPVTKHVYEAWERERHGLSFLCRTCVFGCPGSVNWRSLNNVTGFVSKSSPHGLVFMAGSLPNHRSSPG